MNAVPVRGVPASSVKSATNIAGTAAAPIVDVANSLTGDNQLTFSLIVAGSSDVPNVKFIKGAWDTSRTGPGTGVTFQCDNFPDYASFMAYLTSISTAVTSIEISTDDVANFKGKLTFTEKQFSKTNVVDKPLKKYRQNVGNGYGETITIKDFPTVLWPGQEIMLSNIVATSQVDFTFNVSGWNKSRGLMALTAQTI